jgi:adenylate cyclase
MPPRGKILRFFSSWLVNLLFKQTILVLTVLFCIGVGVALANMSRLSEDLIESNALQNVALYAQTIKEARTLYSAEVVDSVRGSAEIQVSHDHVGKVGVIPLPATYLMHLSQRIVAQNPEMSVRLYSDYPFPWREAEGGAKDDFEQEALQQLRLDASQPFVKIENYQGRRAFRYAEADVLTPSCVGCHNTHPQSPKRDWEVGDVRGVLEITQPIDGYVAQTQDSLRGTFVMLGGLSFLSVIGLSVVMGRLRQTNKELERRVKERTADLVKSNHDLSQSNELVRQVFGRYLTDEVVAQLLETPQGLKLGGERRQVTILTSDLRGFTALSEQLSPEEVVKLLNIYLDYMTDAIALYQGTIDEFMGDGILVLFGAPTQRENDATRAVACAVAMQLAMTAVNEELRLRGLPELGMGVGINTGEVIVGNIGSEKRAKYGVIGSDVNLTYRIESYTVAGQILISEPTLYLVSDLIEIRGQQQVHPKGVQQSLTIYEVSGIGGEYNLYLPESQETLHPLNPPILLSYVVLTGKHVQNTPFQGRLIALSEGWGVIEVEQTNLLPLTNIKITFLALDEQTGQTLDVYAKVLEPDTARPNYFQICFTAKSPEVEMFLNTYLKKH